MYVLACAARYLRARPITWISIAGVALGVAALVAILSIMEGFQRDLRGRFRGTMAEIVVRPGRLEPVPALLARAEAVAGVQAVAPRAMTAGILRTGEAYYPVEVLAVDPEREPQASDYGRFVSRWIEGYLPALVSQAWQLARMVARGAPEPAASRLGALQVACDGASPLAAAEALEAAASDLVRLWPGTHTDPRGAEVVESLRDLAAELRDAIAAMSAARLPFPSAPPRLLGVLLGEELRYHLMRGRVGGAVEVPELLTARTARPGEESEGGVVEHRTPIYRQFAFRSGRLETDSGLLLVPLAAAWASGLVPDGAISELAIRPQEGKTLEEVAAALRDAFPGATVETWEARQRELLRAVALEKGFWALFLFMIVVVAGFVMLATFLMMVAQKTRDLGILRALGATAQGVASIFAGSACLIGVLGTAGGLGLGLLFSRNANAVFGFLEAFGLSPFPQHVYYMTGVPVVVEWDVVVTIAVGTVCASVLLGGVLPALRAARLDPVRALRHE